MVGSLPDGTTGTVSPMPLRESYHLRALHFPERRRRIDRAKPVRPAA